MFELQTFVEDCIQARSEGDSHKAVHAVVERAVSDSSGVIAALGEPKAAGFAALYRSSEITVLNFTWAPLMTLMPHNHNAWAVVGIYSGREDNIFWRKTEGGRIEAAGAKSLMPGSATALGKDIIHSVTNPVEKLTGALHVYGGDFFAPGRSEWSPETLKEAPFDFEKSKRIFREANARFMAA